MIVYYDERDNHLYDILPFSLGCPEYLPILFQLDTYVRARHRNCPSTQSGRSVLIRFMLGAFSSCSIEAVEAKPFNLLCLYLFGLFSEFRNADEASCAAADILSRPCIY